MKRAKAYLLFFSVIVILSSIGVAAEKAVRSFSADLTGSNVIPVSKTTARGEAAFQLKDSGEMSYKLTVTDIQNAAAAHIHEGEKTRNGPPVVLLFTGPKKSGKFSGLLSEGVITPDKMIGSLRGKPIKALADMIVKGDAYVNVHTDKYPDGEIRGQIK